MNLTPPLSYYIKEHSARAHNINSFLISSSLVDTHFCAGAHRTTDCIKDHIDFNMAIKSRHDLDSAVEYLNKFIHEAADTETTFKLVLSTGI